MARNYLKPMKQVNKHILTVGVINILYFGTKNISLALGKMIYTG